MITQKEAFSSSTFMPFKPMMQDRIDPGNRFGVGGQIVITVDIPQFQQVTQYTAHLPGSSSVRAIGEIEFYDDEHYLNKATPLARVDRIFTGLGPVFQQLVEKWYEERKNALSSMAEMIACPSYLRIIGLGPNVLPLIIEQLRREGDKPDHWCAALEAVTGENPVPEDSYGNTRKIANHWIAWHTDRTQQSFLDSPAEITE